MSSHFQWSLEPQQSVNRGQLCRMRGSDAWGQSHWPSSQRNFRSLYAFLERYCTHLASHDELLTWHFSITELPNY